MSGLCVVAATLAATLATTPLSARAESPVMNRIVVHAAFANGSPPDDATITVHVSCANEGGDPVVPVLSQSETFSGPAYDPITYYVPVLEAGGSSTFVGCEVAVTQSNVSGIVNYTCGVTDPGTPPPDPSPPSGCGSQRVRIDAFFPVTVSGAVYDATVVTLLADQPVPAAAPEIVSAPTFTG